MSRATLFLLASAVAGCTRIASSSDDPPRQPPEPPRFDRPEMVRFHMRRHFDDLQAIERLLVAGKLQDAKSRAFLLSKPAHDPGMAQWAASIQDVSSAARVLATSPGIDEALRREVRVAAACAACHLATRKLPVFPAAPAVPRDDPTQAAHMARHQWAADRLWEGIVGAWDAPWRAGLDVLASTPLPQSSLTDAPALAAQLQWVARSALARRADGSETIDGRARAYGEMLVTCAACHASLGRTGAASKTGTAP